MIALIQRVTKGSVTVKGKLIAEIAHGYVVLVGIFEDDTEADVTTCINKIATMRLMSDDAGKMNRSILDTNGELLLVSQFTLCADHTYGRRPSFINAMEPVGARKLFDLAVATAKELGITTQTGKFGEYMDVEIQNDGPVTIIYDTKTH